MEAHWDLRPPSATLSNGEHPSGPGSLRGYIERNSIALLSNLDKPKFDAPSEQWRGNRCDRGKALVRNSGLWNQRHVNESYDPAFLRSTRGPVGKMADAS